jgi:hypothetical protein
VKNIVYILLISFSVTVACKEAATVKENKIVVADSSATNIDNRLLDTDSVVLVYYDDPYDADSLRYTRYYKQVSVAGIDSLGALQKQLMATMKKGEKSACRGEGKIWCFSKGKIFQTLYFSTRCDDCCFIYLIRDGNFYYSKLQDEFADWLKQGKERAVAIQ